MLAELHLLMNNVLVLGASGFIGRRLLARLNGDRVIATYHAHPFSGGQHFDIGTMRLADRFLTGRHGISHAFLLQGVSKLDYCAAHPDETARINVEGTIRAIDDLLDASVKPIFLSSESVFDGSRGPWSEADAQCPILTYGRHKAAVETYLSKISAPWAVARLTKVISGFKDPRNILSGWLDAVAQRQLIRCAYDQILTPTDVDDAANALLFFATTELSGLYNVCGSDPISRHELLKLLLSSAGAEFERKARIEVCSLSDFSFKEPRPKNCSMSNDKFVRASGLVMKSLGDICAELSQSYFSSSLSALP